MNSYIILYMYTAKKWKSLRQKFIRAVCRRQLGVVINNDKSGDPRGGVIFGMRVRLLTARAAPSDSSEWMSSKHPPPTTRTTERHKMYNNNDNNNSNIMAPQNLYLHHKNNNKTNYYLAVIRLQLRSSKFENSGKWKFRFFTRSLTKLQAAR